MKKKTTPRRKPLLLLCLLMWRPTRTIYSTWRSFSVIPSSLPSIVVMLQYRSGSPEDSLDRRSGSHDASSYDLSRVWQPPSS
ncbi:hypothetical protein PIB30_109436, partial [Stylosanthes scabra]|nr:hypothetical protein [Stylosanthes scabra]